MCGLIVSINFKDKTFNNASKVLQQFKAQRLRGTDGFGYVAIKGNKTIYYRSKKEDEIIKKLETLGDTDMILFHHRIPTSAPNVVKANHPILISQEGILNNKYFLIHNGSIPLSETLKKEHEELGIKYSSEVHTYRGSKDFTEIEFNDSEALGIELALFIEGKKDTMDASGGIACFLFEMDKKNKPKNLYYFRNHNPIKFYRNQSGVFFSSAGKGEILKSDVLYRLSLETFKVTSMAWKEPEPTQEPKTPKQLGFTTHDGNVALELDSEMYDLNDDVLLLAGSDTLKKVKEHAHKMHLDEISLGTLRGALSEFNSELAEGENYISELLREESTDETKDNSPEIGLTADENYDIKLKIVNIKEEIETRRTIPA